MISTALRDARFLIEPAAADHRRQEVDKILGSQEPPIGFADQPAWHAYRRLLQQRLAAAGDRPRGPRDRERPGSPRTYHRAGSKAVGPGARQRRRGQARQQAELAAQLDALTPRSTPQSTPRIVAPSSKRSTPIAAPRSPTERCARTSEPRGCRWGTPTYSLVVVDETVEVAANPTSTQDEAPRARQEGQLCGPAMRRRSSW